MQENLQNFLKQKHSLEILFCLVLFVVYLLTQPPNITFEDSPTISAACATLGLNHPPGYPLHTLTCYPIASIAKIMPFTIAQGVATASSIAAVLASFVLVKFLLTITSLKTVAFLSVFLLAIAPVYWSQAIIAEVYLLNALLIVLTMFVVRQWIITKKPKWLLFLSLVTGLGIANHWPLYILTYPAFFFWLSIYWRELFSQLKNLKTLMLCLLLFAIGLAPYLHMLSFSSNAYLFYQDYQNADFFNYVGRSFYQGLNLNLELNVLLLSTLKVSFDFINQFNYIFGLLIIFGLVLMFIERSKLFFGVIWGMLASTGILSIIKPHDQFYEYSQVSFEVYIIPALIFATIPLTFALSWLVRKLKVQAKQRVIIMSLIMLIGLIYWYPKQDRSFEDIAYPHANNFVSSLENNAKVILPIDDVSSIFRYVEKFDPNKNIEFVRTVEYFYNARNNRILSPREVGEKIKSEKNMVGFPRFLRLNNIGVDYYGTHFIYNENVRAGQIAVKINDETRQHIYDLIELNKRELRNYHTRTFVKEFLISLADNLYKIESNYPSQLREEDMELIEILNTIPEGKYGKLYALVHDVDAEDKLARAKNLIAELEEDEEKFSKPRNARIKYMHALAYLEENDLENAKTELEKSLALQPGLFNIEAIIDLLVVYYKLKDIDAYIALRKQYTLPKQKVLVAPDRWCEQELQEPCS